MVFTPRDRDRGQWRAPDKPNKWPPARSIHVDSANKCRTNKMRWPSTALTLRLAVQYAITDPPK